MATQATAHCLTGCAIGEVLGMIIGTSAGLHDGATVALSVALAFFFGYALTMRGVLRAGLAHYNTPDEVERFLATLDEIAATA